MQFTRWLGASKSNQYLFEVKFTFCHENCILFFCIRHTHSYRWWNSEIANEIRSRKAAKLLNRANNIQYVTNELQMWPFFQILLLWIALRRFPILFLPFFTMGWHTFRSNCCPVGFRFSLFALFVVILLYKSKTKFHYSRNHTLHYISLFKCNLHIFDSPFEFLFGLTFHFEWFRGVTLNSLRSFRHSQKSTNWCITFSWHKSVSAFLGRQIRRQNHISTIRFIFDLFSTNEMCRDDIRVCRATNKREIIFLDHLSILISYFTFAKI